MLANDVRSLRARRRRLLVRGFGLFGPRLHRLRQVKDDLLFFLCKSFLFTKKKQLFSSCFQRRMQECAKELRQELPEWRQMRHGHGHVPVSGERRTNAHADRSVFHAFLSTVTQGTGYQGDACDVCKANRSRRRRSSDIHTAVEMRSDDDGIDDDASHSGCGACVRALVHASFDLDFDDDRIGFDRCVVAQPMPTTEDLFAKVCLQTCMDRCQVSRTARARARACAKWT